MQRNLPARSTTHCASMMPRTARWPHAHATSPNTCLLRIALRPQPTLFIVRCYGATFSKIRRARDLYPRCVLVDHIAALAANEPRAFSGGDCGLKAGSVTNRWKAVDLCADCPDVSSACSGRTVATTWGEQSHSS